MCVCVCVFVCVYVHAYAKHYLPSQVKMFDIKVVSFFILIYLQIEYMEMFIVDHGKDQVTNT